MKNDEKIEKVNKKLSLKDRLKDKRERAKIELMLYGIFFLGVIIFARVIGSSSSDIENNNNMSPSSFISLVEDNYEYDMLITINNNIYEYYGKVLGNNSTINLKVADEITNYYLMDKKY